MALAPGPIVKPHPKCDEAMTLGGPLPFGLSTPPSCCSLLDTMQALAPRATQGLHHLGIGSQLFQLQQCCRFLSSSPSSSPSSGPSKEGGPLPTTSSGPAAPAGEALTSAGSTAGSSPSKPAPSAGGQRLLRLFEAEEAGPGREEPGTSLGEGAAAAVATHTGAEADAVHALMQAVENCKPLMKVRQSKEGTKVTHTPQVGLCLWELVCSMHSSGRLLCSSSVSSGLRVLGGSIESVH